MKNNKSDFTSVLPAANQEFLARRIKRLRENAAALVALSSLGISEKIQKNFYLGLSESYVDTKGVVHENALVAPVINVQGKSSSRSVYFNIPHVTTNPASEDFWSRGEPQTYYSEAYKTQETLVVCSSLLDLWSLQSSLNNRKQKPEILFIASSDSRHFPREWYRGEFWSNFKNIYLGYPNDAQGDKIALKHAQFIENGTKRLRLPAGLGATWQQFCQASENPVKDFNDLFDEAKFIGAKFNRESNDLAPGRFGYQPVDIAGAYHNGHLYYPVKTLNSILERYRDEHGNPVSQVATRIEVILIRSDRSVQTVIEVPAPRGTQLDERVIKLTDGTLIESRPKASIHSTWSWNSIRRFKEGKSKTRSLGKILEDVKAFLKQSVWLPFEYDYDLLTLLVPVTFAQAIFQSVPLVLVTGAPGTGKSALGKAMIKICANASMIGQTSAAAIARLIDETKGFVVFDDLESIGRRKGRDAPQFTELVQALKLSYNQETSWKTWTDVSRGMSVKRLNFYGVKMINNTTGSDPILGSRLLKIHTRKIPSHLQNVLGTTEPSDVIELNKLPRRATHLDV
jgi:hypothetical protein